MLNVILYKINSFVSVENMFVCVYYPWLVTHLSWHSVLAEKFNLQNKKYEKKHRSNPLMFFIL